METERAGQILTAREIFDLVREDLRTRRKGDRRGIARVRRDRHHHRPLSAAERRQASSPRPAAALRALRRGRRQDRHPARRGRRNDPRRHARSRRRDRCRADAPRPSLRQRPVGQSHLRAGRRLALHAGVSGGAARAQLPRARSAHRPHADDGRRRTDPARPHRPHRYHRSRLHGTGGPQDRLPLLRLRQAGRGRRRARIQRPKKSWANSPGISGWHSS